MDTIDQQQRRAPVQEQLQAQRLALVHKHANTTAAATTTPISKPAYCAFAADHEADAEEVCI